MLADIPPQLDRYVGRVADRGILEVYRRYIGSISSVYRQYIGSISARNLSYRSIHESADVSTNTQPYVGRVSIIFVMSVMHY